MTSISANGSTQAIYLDMSGTSIKYSIGTLTTPSTYITIVTWPVTITNTGTPNVLRVSAANNLTISSSTGGTSGYLIAGSTHITFDGSNNNITIVGISYPGLIQNGTSIANGSANVIVQNFINIASDASLNSNAGWLCQQYFAKGTTANSIINCINNAVIRTNGTYNNGGIVGSDAATSGGTLSITGCTNNGNIDSSSGSGGIAGQSAGYLGNGVTYTNCINNGSINGGSSIAGNGGIAAGFLGTSTFTNCANNGNINSIDSGGIVGARVGYNGGLITILNCYNTGNITGQYAGGIAGRSFAYDTSRNCIISTCYSTGDISGNRAGGIVGADVGDNNNAAYGNSVLDISNCYSLGAIRTTCGGICGGWSSGAPTLKPTIRITNTYSSGTLVDAGSGLVATSLTSTQINLTTTNTYVAAGSWTDASANAALTGDPTDISTNNPGTTWATIATNTPYILSVYNAALYSPSTGSTSGKTFTTGPGLIQGGGYTYQVVHNTSQINGVNTTRVFVSLGTFPKYYSYNFNTFVLTTTPNGNTRDAISVSINSSTGVINYILPDPPCFLEGTKILSRKNNLEQYRPIQSLRKGDLVKTINHGYVPICMIGTTTIYNPGDTNRIPSRLYKCSKEKYPTLFEDLYITGCHSILVPYLTEDQWNNTKDLYGRIYTTDNHFRLMSWLDEKTDPFDKDGFFNIYHIALENSDYFMNYGIYANGLLVESCSKRYLKELSGMRLLGEEDCTASQYIQNNNVFNKTHNLIETC